MARDLAVNALGVFDQLFEIAGLLVKTLRDVGWGPRFARHESEYRMTSARVNLSRGPMPIKRDAAKTTLVVRTAGVFRWAHLIDPPCDEIEAFVEKPVIQPHCP